MEKIEYIGEVLPDGHLSLPEDVIKQLRLKAHSKLHVQVQLKNRAKRDLSRFCGQWEGDDAEEIVKDIYQSRAKNIRSEKIKL